MDENKLKMGVGQVRELSEDELELVVGGMCAFESTTLRKLLTNRDTE